MRLSGCALACMLLVACSAHSGSGGSGHDGGVALADGSLADGAHGNGDGGGAHGDGGGACAFTIASVTPAVVTQGATGVMLALAGNGFATSGTLTVSVDGTAAPTSGTPTDTMLTVAAPDGAFAAIGTKMVVVSGGGCSASATVVVRSPDSLAIAGWPRHHHDNQNSSVTSAVVAASPTLRWSYPLGSEATSVMAEGGGAWPSPVTAPLSTLGEGEFGGAEVVWEGAPDGTVFSWLAADGSLRFHFTAIGMASYGIDSGSAVRTDGTLYVGISDGHLYALSPDGTADWSYPTLGTSDASAIIAEDGTLLYASDDGHVYALHPDGTLAWMTAAPGEVDSAFATSPQSLGDLHVDVFYAGGANGWFALDPTDGHTLWSVAATGARGATVSSPVVSPDGSTIYGIDSGGHAVALHADGTELWHADFPAGGGATPALVGDTLYAVAIDGMLRAIDAQTGAVRWTADIHDALYNSAGELPTPSVDGHGTVWVFSDDGNVYSFDADGTAHPPLHVCPARAEFIVPQVAIGRDGTLYVAGTDDTLYAYR